MVNVAEEQMLTDKDDQFCCCLKTVIVISVTSCYELRRYELRSNGYRCLYDRKLTKLTLTCMFRNIFIFKCVVTF